ncbi:hypothetical protein B0H19DRAFT_1075778 [Mycena capillaripes]|nr:hypothetical protein B0H19DRAFT_1075778 [Mycena capillaripes]
MPAWRSRRCPVYHHLASRPPPCGANYRFEGPWDQTKFERLLVGWLVACDQPFQEVGRPELPPLLECFHRASKLNVPSASTVQRRVDSMGKDLKKQWSAFFASLQGMVSISPDAWTSSNGYAFLVIIAHYVTNDGKLGNWCYRKAKKNARASAQEIVTVAPDSEDPAAMTSKPSAATAPTVDGAGLRRPKAINFAASVFDQGPDNEDARDELDSYFDTDCGDTHERRNICGCINWPVISCSVVAVERVFSGGKDTISLRRASLKPETIRTLMLLKHHLRLKRKSLEDALLAIQAQ